MRTINLTFVAMLLMCLHIVAGCVSSTDTAAPSTEKQSTDGNEFLVSELKIGVESDASPEYDCERLTLTPTAPAGTELIYYISVPGESGSAQFPTHRATAGARAYGPCLSVLQELGETAKVTIWSDGSNGSEQTFTFRPTDASLGDQCPRGCHADLEFLARFELTKKDSTGSTEKCTEFDIAATLMSQAPGAPTLPFNVVVRGKDSSAQFPTSELSLDSDGVYKGTTFCLDLSEFDQPNPKAEVNVWHPKVQWSSQTRIIPIN